MIRISSLALMLAMHACGGAATDVEPAPSPAVETAADERASAATAETVAMDYFPPGTFHPDNSRADDHVRQWYSSHLTAMGEPLLHGAADIEAYRFVHLPTWGPPVVVRIELRGETIELTHRVLSGNGGYDPGTLTTDHTRAATSAELDSVRQAIATTDFWNQPTRSDAGLDGAQWIIEAVVDGRYHVVDRWSPEADGPHAEFVAACTALRDLAVDG